MVLNDVVAIRNQLNTLETDPAYAAANLFATGCWLHAHGAIGPGKKSIDIALSLIGLPKKNHALYRRIHQGLAGNEKAYADAIFATHEINQLWAHQATVTPP